MGIGIMIQVPGTTEYRHLFPDTLVPPALKVFLSSLSIEANNDLMHVLETWILIRHAHVHGPFTQVGGSTIDLPKELERIQDA